MAEKVYYFLNGCILAILIAINIHSQGEYVSVMVIYALLWTTVELIYGMIRDVIEIKRERERNNGSRKR